MNILLGILVWLAMCSSILILASLAIKFEGEQQEKKLKGYIGYIEKVYNRNVTDQKKIKDRFRKKRLDHRM